MVRPMKHIALLAGLLLIAIPTASATMNVSSAIGDLELEPGTTTKIPVLITVSCEEFVLAGATSLTFKVGSDARADWNAVHPDITVEAGPACVPGGSVGASGDISLSPGDDAFGLRSQTLKIWAVSGDTNLTFDRSGKIWTAYVGGHTMSTDVTFPASYTGGDALFFNLTVEITANSNSMIMFFPNPSAGNGSVSGFASTQFFLDAGDSPTKTFQVKWTPPTGNWDNATFSFRKYSHCLNGGELNSCNMEDNEGTVTWTMVNDAPKPPVDDKPTPGVGAGLLVGVIAAALVVLRRR